ncbi:FecR family protein [Pedobacter cryoconitis]|uniref:FecR family protein n=1 Tax=Pedobacter cryoconitis TaxID=188932 RepID=UPI001C86C362|nr:FecR family protein [Pedobacter cryoconitis]
MDTQIINLLQKYIDGQCNQLELEEVFRILKNGRYEAEWKQVIAEEADYVLSSGAQSELSEVEVNNIYAGISAQLPSGMKKPYKLWPRIVAVAATVSLMVIGVYFFYYSKDNDSNDVLVVNDVAPGGVGATLTLANGKQVKLSNAASGEIAREAGISVKKTAEGQLVYEIKETTGGPDKFNTLTTAEGETYILTLPDKSKVWMNAASSLTYSSSLNEHGVRRVKLEGEAYFQITKDKLHPFVVESGGQEVEVLGTHFNINSYKDEHNTKTTLLEGSVKVRSAGGNRIILKPNQQAELDGDQLNVKEVNAKYAIAWKDGYFMFNNENLETVMTRIARWYKVRIVFEDEEAKGGNYFGTISRYEEITKVLKMLSRTELITFKIEGNTIKINKKK